MPVVASLKFYSSRVLLLVIVSWLVLVPKTGHAFESYEHKHLGDLALRIAVDYAQVRRLPDSQAYWQGSHAQRCAALAADVSQFYRDATGATCPSVDAGAPSYGDLVRLVDHIPYPYKLLDAPRATLSDGIPTSFSQLNQYVLREGTGYMTSNLAKATANNELHFQLAAISAMTTLHRKAIELVRTDKLFAALATNALADHFLHDFFAPGHITVNRDNSHDAIALGMHDTSNRAGASFRIDQGRWDSDLAPLLDFIADNHRMDRGAYSLALNGEGEMSAEQFSGLVAEFKREHQRIHLYGDDLLHKHPRQQLLMLLINVRSLLDVLEPCALAPCRENSLNEFLWQDDDDRDKVNQPMAGIAYGEYELEARQLSQSSNVFILSVGGEAPLSEFGSSRLEITTELVPLKFIGASDFLYKHTINRPTLDCPVFSACNIAPAFGVTYLRDERFNAFGPSLRLIKAFPKIDLQLSGYYQYLTYDLKHDGKKPSYGLRIDTGFSLYTAFIGIGKGYFVHADEQLDADTVISFGMAFGMPLTRLGLDW
jgi:hypothetical protein